ncbi:Ppx/GppA family phosphatase [Oxalobacter vibrioformis]|uniref:Ppx/GppA family phosphatase n=1 Tax=Oxalobacter vibrioformis TaxID=933080 RepID=A0A9E9P423_9BURK|nr:Ppx/GppA phosphatase family protein [Oxalobacter vibrioformis]WAW10845.1 Ppx/GppA family phosphatase [Oxalobacter vibrioformis]
MLSAIDLGSNSFRLQIGEYVDGAIRVIRAAREPNRLAAGLDKNNHLTDAAIQGGLDALRSLSSILKPYPISVLRAVATNTLRVAVNAPDFLVQAEAALGYPIEVISGEEEGRLIYLGVDNLLARPDERRLVIDIGGGSTEMIRGRGEAIERVESFSVGTVGQSLDFFPGGVITAAGFDAAILSARSHFEDVKSYYHKRHWKMAYGSSGTMRAIAELISTMGIGDGRLTAKNLDLLRLQMIRAGKISQLGFPGLRPERAASVVGGLSIMIVLMTDLKMPVMVPVESGLRMGIMWDLCLQSTEHDRREQSVSGFMRRYKADRKRAARVADWATVLYEKMAPDSDRYKKLLHWSALMHEVGMFVSPSNYHKHGAYLVENADLAGFTAREQKQMGKLVLAQKGNLRKLNGIFDNPDAVKAVLAIRLAVIFMHSRVSEAVDAVGFRMKKRIEILMPEKWLKQHQTLSYWLGRERDWWADRGISLLIRES